MAYCAKIVTRINHSTWTKAYVALGVLQLIVVAVIQSIIAVENQFQENHLTDRFFTIYDPAGVSNADPLLSPRLAFLYKAIIRFERMKWENIAFVAFLVWFLSMVVDATVYQNAPEIFTLATFIAICPIVVGLELYDGHRWFGRLVNPKDNNDNAIDIDLDVTHIRISMYLEIALIACFTVFAAMFLYVSYQVVKDIGWRTYTKIGPDIKVQSKYNHKGSPASFPNQPTDRIEMYQTFQFFVLALKVAVFMQFFVPLFYVIQLVALQIDYGYFMTWEDYYCIVVTTLMIPALIFARLTVASEHRGRMIVFIIFELSAIVNMCLVLYQTSESEWPTWIAIVSVSIASLVSTITLAALCAYNFGKGLKPHVQRGKSNILPEHQPLDPIDVYDGGSESSWKIDE